MHINYTKQKNYAQAFLKFFFLWAKDAAQGGKGLAPCHLEPQQHRAAEPPS